MISLKSPIVSLIQDSNLERSATKAKILAFKMCLRKAFPSPFPSDAPSMSPGMSITLNLKSPTDTEPRFGTRVVKG